MTSPLSDPNTLLKAAVKSPVYLYRYVISPILGPRCRHLPTCSQYALDAIDVNGVWIGGWLTLGRIGRCHPWGTMAMTQPPTCDRLKSRCGLLGGISVITRARKRPKLERSG